MAWGNLGQRSGISDKVAGTTITMTVGTATVLVGSVLFVFVVSDNIATATGSTNDHLDVDDSGGNTYTKLGEYTRSSGAAADGSTVSLWGTKVTTGLTTAVATITGTFSGSIDASAITAYEVSTAAGKTFGKIAEFVANGSGTAVSNVPAGLAATPHLFLHALGVEGPSSDAITQDADYAAVNRPGTTGGVTPDTNVTMAAARRIATEAGNSCTPTLGVARDWTSMIIVVDEVDPVTSYDLVVQDGAHASSADGATLVQNSTLVVADAGHGQLADSVPITKQSAIVVSDGAHAHLGDNVPITKQSAIVLADGLHVHRAGSLPAQPPGLNDSVVLTQVHVLSGVGDGAHAHAADNLVLAVGAVTLAVSDGAHAQVADNAAITKQSAVVVADGQHAHAADLALITKQSTIAIDEARSLHAADTPTLTYSTTLVVADGRSTHAADTPTLFDPYKVLNLNAVAVADDVQLTWDNVTALTGESYEVERDGLVIASGIGTTSYIDSNLPSATYTYRVRAVELVGAGGWEPTAFEGGGFQNVLSLSSLDPQRMVMGSDVAGTHRSMDGGATWETTSTGIESLQQTRNAAVAHSQVTASRVFMAAGAEGVGGGFFRSDDDGFSWTLLSNVPQFSGSNNSAPLPTTHPRSTGRLIALDEANGYIYVGTFSGGVMRSTDGGVNWTVIWGAGASIRSLVIDPANPQVLLVGVYNAGGFSKAYRLTSIRTTASASQLTGLTPTSVEELAFGPSGALYAACGTGGIYKSSTSPYTSWSAINTGIETTGPSWQSVVAYNVAAGADRMWVGCTGPELHSGSNYKSMKFSTDGGTTWADRTVPGTNGVTIDQTIYGESIPWWMFETGANKSGSALMINKSAMVASQIIVDSTASPPRVFVVGRSGAWISVDEGLTWRPMVHGLLVTIQKDIAVDPADPLRIALANTDWTCIASDDGMATVNQNRPTWTLQAGGSAMGLWADYDTGTTPSTLVEGVGDRDNTSGDGAGEMFSCQDPANDGAWTNEGLQTYVVGLEGASKRTLGGAVGRNGGTRVVVTSVFGTGLLRKSGTTWSRPLSLATNGVCPTSETTKYHPMEWPNKTVGRIYWYDRETGIWRSTDFGATWTCIWRAGQASLPSSGNDAYSFMAADPATVGRIYVCTSTDVYKVDNAHTVETNGAEATRVQVGSGVIARPGPVRVRDDGAVFVTQRIGTGSPAALWRSTDAGSTWTDVSDEYYRAANILPFQLVIGSDGVMWSANNGNGVTKGL